MKRFPLFISLQNKPCIVVGGGNIATRRIETLLQFGAKITVMSEQVSEPLEKLAHAGEIQIKLHSFQRERMDEAFLVLACTDNREINQSVYEEAVKNNCFINVCDDPHKSTFHFPAVIARDDLVIGISSDGAFPAFIKQLKQKIENLLPVGVGKRLKEAKIKRNRMDLSNKEAVEKVCAFIWDGKQ